MAWLFLVLLTLLLRLQPAGATMWQGTESLSATGGGLGTAVALSSPDGWGAGNGSVLSWTLRAGMADVAASGVAGQASWIDAFLGGPLCGGDAAVGGNCSAVDGTARPRYALFAALMSAAEWTDARAAVSVNAGGCFFPTLHRNAVTTTIRSARGSTKLSTVISQAWAAMRNATPTTAAFRVGRPARFVLVLQLCRRGGADDTASTLFAPTGEPVSPAESVASASASVGNVSEPTGSAGVLSVALSAAAAVVVEYNVSFVNEFGGHTPLEVLPLLEGLVGLAILNGLMLAVWVVSMVWRWVRNRRARSNASNGSASEGSDGRLPQRRASLYRADRSAAGLRVSDTDDAVAMGPVVVAGQAAAPGLHRRRSSGTGSGTGSGVRPNTGAGVEPTAAVGGMKRVTPIEAAFVTALALRFVESGTLLARLRDSDGGANNKGDAAAQTAISCAADIIFVAAQVLLCCGLRFRPRPLGPRERYAVVSALVFHAAVRVMAAVPHESESFAAAAESTNRVGTWLVQMTAVALLGYTVELLHRRLTRGSGDTGGDAAGFFDEEDDRFATELLLRYRSLRPHYVVYVLIPLVLWLMSASVLSWRSQYLVLLMTELINAYCFAFAFLFFHGNMSVS